MTWTDRRRKLRLQLLEGNYFFKAEFRAIRGRVVVFNPASRPNCICRWQLLVKDTDNRTLHVACQPSEVPDGQGNERPVNSIPCTIQQGSGVTVDLYGFDYKAVRVGRECTFVVIAEDIYGRQYKQELSYQNEWPHEQFKDDL